MIAIFVLFARARAAEDGRCSQYRIESLQISNRTIPVDIELLQKDLLTIPVDIELLQKDLLTIPVDIELHYIELLQKDSTILVDIELRPNVQANAP